MRGLQSIVAFACAERQPSQEQTQPQQRPQTLQVRLHAGTQWPDRPSQTVQLLGDWVRLSQGSALHSHNMCSCECWHSLHIVARGPHALHDLAMMSQML